MTTPQFIEWLDRKMAEHAEKTKLPDKLIPPLYVLSVELNQRIEQKVRATLTERILREAGLDRQVREAIAKIKKPSPTSWPAESRRASSARTTRNGAPTSRPRPRS
jgi:hypothetical protein